LDAITSKVSGRKPVFVPELVQLTAELG
jgi:hypothetical protein